MDPSFLGLLALSGALESLKGVESLHGWLVQIPDIGRQQPVGGLASGPFYPLTFPPLYLCYLGGVVHRAPQPISEKLALTGRGQVTGCYLRWEPFSELGSNAPILFLSGILITWVFP